MISIETQGFTEAVNRLNKAKTAVPDAIYGQTGLMMQTVYGNVKRRIPNMTRLARSFVISKAMERGLVKGTLSTGIIYARVQNETETTIYPKNAKALTIPTEFAKRKSGAEWMGDVAFRARSYPNTFIAKGMIMQKQPDGSVLPLFKLVKSVKVKGVHYADGALTDSQAFIINTVMQRIQASL